MMIFRYFVAVAVTPVTGLLVLGFNLFEDFFWNLTFNQSRDSQPATEGAAKNDYSIVTSLGWSFG